MPETKDTEPTVIRDEKLQKVECTVPPASVSQCVCVDYCNVEANFTVGMSLGAQFRSCCNPKFSFHEFFGRLEYGLPLGGNPSPVLSVGRLVNSSR